MAYAKWVLDQRNEYQLCVAVLQGALILTAEETDTDGPYEMGYEVAGLGGWDDILVVSCRDEMIIATHCQVKSQSTDFNSKEEEASLSKYFQDAANLLNTAHPYGDGETLPAECRRFFLGFPQLNLDFKRPGNKKKIPLRSLDGLARACHATGNSHLQIAASNGAGLDSNEQAWLSFIGDAVGSLGTATTILRQLEVRALGDNGEVLDQAERSLATVWRRPKEVIEGIQKAIRKSNPFSRLRYEDLFEFVRHSERSILDQRVSFRRSGESYLVKGDKSIRDSIACVWRPANASQMHIDFGCSSLSKESLAVRNAVLRLGLHTFGVAAVGGSHWWAAAREGLGGAIGTSEDAIYMDESFFQHKSSLPKRTAFQGTHAASSFCQDLCNEMDMWLWHRVQSQVQTILESRTTTLRAPLLKAWVTFSSQIQPNWSRILQRLLKAPCEGQGVQAELRAGPRMVTLLSQTLVIITCLHALKYASLAANETDVGVVGDCKISGLALEKLAGGSDVPGGVELYRRARDLLRESELLVLGSKTSTAEIEEFAKESLLTGSMASSSLSSSESAIPVISFEAKFCRELNLTEDALRRYIDQRMRRATKATLTTFSNTMKSISAEEEHAA